MGFLAYFAKSNGAKLGWVYDSLPTVLVDGTVHDDTERVWFSALGFSHGGPPGERMVRVRLSIAAVVLAMIASLLWQASRYAGRVAAGQCTACACDLRATPGRCPECGRAVAAIV